MTFLSKARRYTLRIALIYNYHLKNKDLDFKYPLIQEGDKIKFILLKEPNPFKFNVCSYISSLLKNLILKNMLIMTCSLKRLFRAMRFILGAISWSVNQGKFRKFLVNMTQLDIIISWFLLIFAFRIGANLALTRLTFIQLLMICSAIKFLEVAYTS